MHDVHYIEVVIDMYRDKATEHRLQKSLRKTIKVRECLATPPKLAKCHEMHANSIKFAINIIDILFCV